MYQIANSINTWQIGFHLLIDAHASSVAIESLLHQHFQATSIGTTADRHQDILTNEALLILARPGNNLFLLTLVFDTLYFRTCNDVNAALFKDAYKQSAHLFVNRCQNIG